VPNKSTSTKKSVKQAAPSRGSMTPTKRRSGPSESLPTWKPHKYQRTGVKWLTDNQYATLFFDPGLGKTTCVLEALRAVRKNGDGGKTLIIAPKRVCYLVWSHIGEVGKWAQFSDLRVSLLHGKDKEDRLEEDADLYVVNFDGVRWLCTPDRDGKIPLRKLIDAGVDTVVIDELSKFKNASGKTFKMFKPYAFAHFVNRWGLTGSPAPNGLIDLFGQMLIVDGGRTLGGSVVRYRNQYFHPSGYMGYEWKLNTGAERDIYRAISPVALTMRATDHLDLPPLIEQNVFVDLPPTVMKAYREVEEDLFTAIANKKVYAANAAVASGKCRQIASGGIYIDGAAEDLFAAPTRSTQHLHDEKTDALADLIDELQGKPLLIFYEFNHDYDRIAKAFNKPPVINGKLNDSKLANIVGDWNAGRLPILCGHPAAMGHGLNLQAAGSHVAWYTLTWDYDLYDQAIRRVWRQGVNAARVIVHRFLARGTIDEVVARAINAKRKGQDALFEGLKQLRAEREKAA
jgi:SNF2 family DNA or RNA helicase